MKEYGEGSKQGLEVQKEVIGNVPSGDSHMIEVYRDPLRYCFLLQLSYSLT
ncbi:hypothetical protein GCM10007423_23700 [Dyadobacter endophyticus]|uniref:Uncharacterized protein n=1 Tax=Dyadobacter endophyticus TaxID=1749036 RepID=A0ABQ1YP80_9BACT|nr:hypothetical protein GCM10007423_23700 [Dyadobacter endophyticus]